MRMTRFAGIAAITLGALAILSQATASSQTRERRPEPPGTIYVSPLAFSGGWQVTLNRTETYTLVLQITNPVANTLLNDLQVQGNLIAPAGTSQGDGALQGTIPRGTRTLHFTFSQPGTNRAGPGQLTLSPDGSTISGNSNAGGVYSTWRGTRAK